MTDRYKYLILNKLIRIQQTFETYNQRLRKRQETKKETSSKVSFHLIYLQNVYFPFNNFSKYSTLSFSACTKRS